MIRNRLIIITLLLGLIILPLFIEGSETPDPPGDGTLTKTLWPKQQLNKKNMSKIMTKRLHRLIARKKFARKLQQMTIPFLDTLDSVPKFLKDLEETVGTTNSSQITNKTGMIFKRKDDTSKPYAKLLRVFIQFAWNDAWELFSKKKTVRVDEV
ncbi:uncharacterized protein LOC110179582 isoform X2 [Drosophila serrata]|uniref:uncharacterized protein LOC110179582 isoform X2 n=1 Tax=Drosophila serrata TaxID=7274 RepID=UPI000A1CF7AF|nr:uncharacterized protein LOC110179582 isoform X2 [Drosophila serrata]